MTTRSFVSGAMAAATVVLCACASGGGGGTGMQHPSPHTRVSVDSARIGALAAVAAPATAQQGLPVAPRLPSSSEPVLASAPPSHIDVDADRSDIREVARKVADNLGYDLQIDPAVSGRVTMSLRNATLDQAMTRIVTENGYSYRLQGRVLRIEPVRLETKIFNLDYVSLQRYSSANTTIQRRLQTDNNNLNNNPSQMVGTGAGLNSGGFAGAAGVGGDVIAGISVSDLWQEIRVTLDGVMRPIPGRDSGAVGGSTPSPSQTAGMNGVTSNAFSQTYSDGSRLIISPLPGMITVTANPAKLEEVGRVIDAFQSSVQRQVLIEAKIVEVQLTKKTEFGIDWSVIGKSGSKFGFQLNSDADKVVSNTGSAGNVTFSLTGGNVQINAVLNALNTQGNVNVLSNPRVSTLNNQRATFDVTTDEPFFSEQRQPVVGPTGAIVGYNTSVTPATISVGIVLDVLPQISADNVVSMNVRPVITSLLRTETFTGSDGATARIPVTDRREGDTMLRVRNGETVILGGLMQTQHNVDTSGIPLLQDLPLLGKLFRHVTDDDRRVELVVFLTPTVIAGQPATGR